MEGFTEIERDYCQKLLQRLLDHPLSMLFLRPVDPERENVPDYFRIISEPMDLGTISAKLANGDYANSVGFIKDLDLVWSNAMLYNRRKFVLLAEVARVMKAKCDKALKSIPKTKFDEWHRRVAKTNRRIQELLAGPFPEDALVPRKPEYSLTKSSLDYFSNVQISLDMIISGY